MGGHLLVRLHEPCSEDSTRAESWLSDPNIYENWIGRYTYGVPAVVAHTTPGEHSAAAFAERKSCFQFIEDRHESFSIRTVASEEHIGVGHLAIDSRHSQAQLSVLIGPPRFWNRRYGSAATLALMGRAFEALRLSRLWTDVPEFNESARDMLDRLGFKHSATLRHLRTHRDAKFVSLVMGQLSGEYRARYPAGMTKEVMQGLAPLLHF